ncbi:MAG: GNAT family N-acetyltransferase, partial [Firmicutes bacterium]|nr:GNAT family N-acetyltransferase [Bacillota bacterium]
MIRNARPQDHPQVKALWGEAFGDPPEAIDAYFLNRHKDENMLVDERSGGVAGMLSMLPVTLASGDGREFPSRYIYAVATRERDRGQGIGTALLHAAHARMRDFGEAASVLVPGEPRLFSFYEKRGYTTMFDLDELTVSADRLPPLPPDAWHGDCSPAEYTRLRNLAFQTSGLYARWEERAVAYAMQTFAQPGGVIKLRWAGGRGCAAWEQTPSGVLVRELALPQGNVYDALCVLHSALRAAHYTVRLSKGTI